MMISTTRMVILGLMLTLLSAVAGFGGTATDMARRIYHENKGCIVTLSAVADVQINIPGRGNQAQEQRIEVTGTVINDQGLTLVPNTSIDLARTMKASLPSALRRMNADVKVEVNDVNFIFRDGTELPAKIVLKDAKLDLAFVLPDPKDVEEEGVAFRPLKLASEVTEVQVLDELLMFGRLGKDFDREISVYQTKVEAVINKPRHVIITHNNSSGTPAFNLEGQVVGFFVKKVVGKRIVGNVLLPISEALETIEEARNAKPDENDDEAESEEETDAPNEAPNEAEPANDETTEDKNTEPAAN